MTRGDGRRPLYGLILAGGRSSRLGQDKALLRRDGRSQLENLSLALASVTAKTFVSARPDQRDEPERGRFPQIVDRYTDIGPVAGILSAMDEYPDADWLVVACDLPNVETATLQHLFTHRSATCPFTAFRSSHDGLPEPLCAIYRAQSHSIVREFVDAGVVCPRKMLIRSDTELLDQPDPRALDNVNTPDDLEKSHLKAAS